MENVYRAIFKAFERAKIRYLVVGGVAVNLLGYRRFTADIDILLALDPKNLEKMTRLMKKIGYTERLPVQLKELSDATKVQKWLEEKNMTAYTFLSERRLRLDIDVLAGASLRFDEYDQRKVLIDAGGGLRIPVISLNDLLEMKQAANRGKDVQDIQVLLELKGL